MRRAWLLLLLTPGACLFPDLGDLGGDASSSDVFAPDVADVAVESSIDAGGDAGDAAEAGFCASLGDAHSFCEDFDESTVFNAQFTNTHVSTDGLLGNDTIEFVTPPRALFATIPAEGAKTGDDAYMTRLFTGTATKATYAFDFRVDSFTSGQAGVFASIVFDDGVADAHVLAIYVTDTYTSLEESFSDADGGAVYKDHKLTIAIAASAWTHVSFGVDVGALTCTASLDGQPAASAAIDPSWKPATAAIDLGFTYVGSETTAWQARYDDVVFDFQ